MPSGPTNQETEKYLRQYLEAEGYELSRPRGYGETGVDIIATRADETIHIEVIGFKSSPPARSRDFYAVFFGAISRLRDGAERIAIALPSRFGNGLHQRAAQYGAAWERIGSAFPELEIWLVDCDEPYSYERTKWNVWAS